MEEAIEQEEDLKLSANLEWLFTENAASAADRVRRAAAHRLKHVEIWGWRDKDVDGLREALMETGVTLSSMIVDPQLQLTDPANRALFVDAVRDSAAQAGLLDCRNLVVVAGDRTSAQSRVQSAAVRDALEAGLEVIRDQDVRLLLEPLNSRVHYHADAFLTSTEEALEIVTSIGSPQLLLLFDVYHSVMMGEDAAEVIRSHVPMIGHIQVADVPDRSEPGTGTIDWRDIADAIRASGYSGAVGLEYMPSRATVQTLDVVQKVFETSLE